MDIVLEETLKRLGPSHTRLYSDTVKKIHELFPVPREQKILWADVEVTNRVSGMVITKQGIFLRASEEVIKEDNKDRKKKDKIFSQYYYMKWAYFNPEDFNIRESYSHLLVYYNKRYIAKLSNKKNFFQTYSDSYNDIVKESAVNTANFFAGIESTIPGAWAQCRTKTGHGEMAEEALNLIDKLDGADAKVLGRDNAKNGPDRFVNGVFIQTKYHKTARSCVESCFDKSTGMFRYRMPDGENMLIEVPSDKYAEAVNLFRQKILEGKVPGITDPNEANQIIKKGRLSYQQAVNLTKPGTIESLAYDAATGIVTCSFAFGISFLVTFLLVYAQTGNRHKAMDCAMAAGIQTFGLSFISHVLTQQIARTVLPSQFITASAYIVDKLGFKTTQSIVNALRSLAGKGAISGAAAKNQLAKILRSNAVTAVITLVVFAAPDTYGVFSKKLSGAQYSKNMLSLVGSLTGGGAGVAATAFATAKIGAITGTSVSGPVGTVLGFAGGMVGGFAGGVAVKAVGDFVREDDSVILSRLFNAVIINLAYDYMLSDSELNVIVEKLNGIKPRELKKLLQAVFASNNKQEKIIDDFLRHYFEEVIRQRAALLEPTPDDLVNFFDDLAHNDTLVPYSAPEETTVCASI